MVRFLRLIVFDDDSPRNPPLRNECVEAFGMFTADAADGLLGTIELDRVLRMLGIEPNAQELKAVMDEFGQHSGKLNQDDFLDLMERQLMSRKKTEFDVAPEFAQFLRDSFHLYDKDKDGSITKAEIKTIFRPGCSKFEVLP